ncbi:MAG: metal-dependent hydrolase [Desulfobacteraceae bacterium 4572_130]|nr:MAG: metal-dependent hydrolase [Desulfobacteraceae bacterium 4572_130]
MQKIELGNIAIEVKQKNIKNIYLSVYPPLGKVKISAPKRMNLNTIRIFAISKLCWIKKQQQVFKNQEREIPKKYLSRESHYFKGKKYLLKLVEQKAKPKVILKHSRIELYVRPNATTEKKEQILNKWYRSELKNIVPQIIEKWEKKIGVKSNEFGIRKMRTKWGTCNIKAKRIWLNLELAKKTIKCLEYIIVHELLHLLERKHNNRFVSLMDKFMPKWKFYKDELNKLGFGYVHWNY